MSFEDKIKRILEITEIFTLNELLREFEVENINELEKAYGDDPETFIKRFFSQLVPENKFFNHLITEDREFLEYYNEKVKHFINYMIKYSSNEHYFERNRIGLNKRLEPANQASALLFERIAEFSQI